MEFDVLAAVDMALANKSDEQKAREVKEQEERRAKFKLPSDMEIKRQYGVRMQQIALNALAKNPDSEFEIARLAESYALQGLYEDASATTNNTRKKAWYDAVISALDGAPDCECPQTQRIGNQTIENRFLKERVFARGKIVNLYACAVCGHLRC